MAWRWLGRWWVGLELERMRMQSYPRMILCMNEEEESPLEVFLLPPAGQDQQLLQPIGTRVSTDGSYDIVENVSG